jgi:hypothetical protein
VRALIAAERDHGAALPLLEDALLAAALLGMGRPFLVEAPGLRALVAERIEAGTGVAGFAVDLLSRMSGQHDRQPPAPATLIEALTEREHVVLRYLASTLSNAEIAAQLYLSSPGSPRAAGGPAGRPAKPAGRAARHLRRRHPEEGPDDETITRSRTRRMGCTSRPAGDRLRSVRGDGCSQAAAAADDVAVLSGYTSARWLPG